MYVGLKLHESTVLHKFMKFTFLKNLYIYVTITYYIFIYYQSIYNQDNEMMCFHSFAKINRRRL